ncbi:uncharacterized protein LOC123032883 [Varanus komodoensis]|uniref:uncharacterized protein LOC123032883 n=1 Tax=Varanus komodoensis TaxID=61221 RepID=UPI001CF7987B|nr:uncharacterized protein LOC123032883 [Varanus komodoensis]
MLLATCIVFASAVLRARLLQCPTRQFQFVNIGDKAKICCNYAEKAELPGYFASWHKRKEDAVPLLVYSCPEIKTVSRYVCRGEGQMLILEIKDAQVTDSGQYLCAMRDRGIYLGSSLIVGDSYTPSTRVTLLQPPAGEPPALLRRHSPLACLVQGVSNLVQVSWHTPEGPQRGSRTLLVKNSSGSLTFLKLLHVPANAHLSGGSVACEVRFNASGSSVKKSGWLPAGE